MAVSTSPAARRARAGSALRSGPAGPGPRRSRSAPRGSTVLAFTGPFFALFGFAILVPAGYAVYLSFFQTRRTGFGPARSVFAGLANYTHVLADPAYRSGFLVIVLYCLLFIPLVLGVALALALLLDSTLARARKLVQTGLFIPHAVPGLIAAMVWLYLYTPGISPVVGALHHVGVGFDILHLPGAVAAVVNLGVWEGVGYNTLVFYAALQAIPRDNLEAALVDGAGEVRTALSIKLPQIAGMVGVNGMFALIGTLQLFTEPFLLNLSTPAIPLTWTPMMYIYDSAFYKLDYGATAAASVLLALFVGSLSFVAMRWVSRRRTQ